MKKYLIYALTGVLLAACGKEELPESGPNSPGEGDEIRFEIGIAPPQDAIGADAKTRVATDTKFKSTWEDGDQIGIFAAPHDAPLAATGNIIHNVKLTYTGGKWTADEPLYWPKDGTKLDFWAYHPYDAALTDPTQLHAFYVHADQSASTGGKSHFSLSDVMRGISDNGNGYGWGETVVLSFEHLMAMVQVTVSSSMLGNYPPDALKVSLRGCHTDKLLLRISSGSHSCGKTTPVTITMYPCPNDGGAPGIYAYRALVPPFSIDPGTAMFSFEYGGNVLLRSQPLAEILSLWSGQVETFDMTFPFTSVTVSATKRLADLLPANMRNTVTHLKVLGEMTATDFNLINAWMPLIISLDLSGATVEGDAIPSRALLGKAGLKEFIFPLNIKAISKEAFYDCTGLTGSLTIPQGVTTIGESAFSGCSGFTGSLSIPQSVTTIGNLAFFGCSGFSGSLKIPQGVTWIGDNSFDGCSGFTGSLIIPKGVTWIGDYAFYECKGLNGSLTIPQGVKSIADYAFRRCGGLNGPLTIPKGVTWIGHYAFSECGGFNGSLTIPEGVTWIGHYAFSECGGFNGSLTIPEGVTWIGNYAFDRCRNLTSITCHVSEPDKVTYGTNPFSYVPFDIPVNVPATAVDAYRNHNIWKRFTNIQAIPEL